MAGPVQSGTALVTGATGQDGWYLVRRLLAEGWRVFALARDTRRAAALFGRHPRLLLVEADLRNPAPICELIGDLLPEEFYNLGGESSVAASFESPWAIWDSNANAVAQMLEAVRRASPLTRFYQASSGEMFGWIPGGDITHDEEAPLNAQSPYAASKAAAHLYCRSYRHSFDLRIACGILFNHESHRRGPSFLSRKVVDHVLALRADGSVAPLEVGNLKARRDWGFAAEYVDGMIAILRQASRRGVQDEGSQYRDYVLGTGRLHAVWELVDRAFALAGFELEWHLDDDDPQRWHARFSGSGDPAVVVASHLIRPSDPQAIAANPARARDELGWAARPGLDGFLSDMLSPSGAGDESTAGFLAQEGW